MTQSQRNSRPSYVAYAVEGDGKEARWTKIGAVWPHNDGEGFNVHLLAFPVNGSLIIRKPKAEREQSDQQGRRA